MVLMEMVPQDRPLSADAQVEMVFPLSSKDGFP
jgi:hypothetical protein